MTAANGIQNGVANLHLSNGNSNGHSNGSAKSGAETTHRKMDRKQSSPMMPAFMVSAPGKVIVFGEHAVVHGKAAIAASISLRSYLLVTSLSKSKRTVSLRFPDVDLIHTWDIDALPWDIFSRPGKKKMYYDLVTSLDPDLVAALKPHLEHISPSKSEPERKVHQNAAFSFLYLFCSLGSQRFPGCLYTLRSTIPIGAGLGSSGSIAVCMSAALLLQLRTLSGPHPDQPAEEAKVQIERINRWAFVAEMCIHGNPSGVDNTVSAQGKALLFQRPNYYAPPEVRPLWRFPELPLLIVDTRQAKSTAHEVAKVARLKDTHPSLVGSILDAVDSVTKSAATLIEEAGSAGASENESSEEEDESADGASRHSRANLPPATCSPDTLRRLGELMTINHGLLVALGVSHPKLERVRELADHEAQVGWTKLTGAGGGGCSITLLKSGMHSGNVGMRTLEKRLGAQGFAPFMTTLAGDGVGVLWPAVLRNGMDEDEEGGMEIDVEKFLNADGTEGVERLVGVHGTTGEREGWKFWRVDA